MSDKLVLMKRYWWWPPIIIVVFLCCWCWYCYSDTGTTILLVRHAEKVNVGDSDPSLSPAGLVRAEALGHVVSEAGVTSIFATQFQRTQLTVQPAADQLGLSVTQYTADDIVGLTSIINSNWSGQTVLVVCHSNTATQIIEQLGGAPIGIIPEAIYDEFYVVTKYRCRATRVLHLRYGAPS